MLNLELRLKTLSTVAVAAVGLGAYVALEPARQRDIRHTLTASLRNCLRHVPCSLWSPTTAMTGVDAGRVRPAMQARSGDFIPEVRPWYGKIGKTRVAARSGQLPKGTMSKRDVINEIRERYARNQGDFSPRRADLADLTNSFRRLGEGESLAQALHVIGIVACIEVAVRDAIKRLIDHGPPFLDRVEGFKEHLRFDFALTKALSLRQITFGDLVAHSLPISSVEHIASHFEALFAEGGSGTPFAISCRIYVSSSNLPMMKSLPSLKSCLAKCPAMHPAATHPR